MPPDSAFKVLQLYFSDSPPYLIRTLNPEHTNVFVNQKWHHFHIGMLNHVKYTFSEVCFSDDEI